MSVLSSSYPLLYNAPYDIVCWHYEKLNCTPMNCLSASLHSVGFTQFWYVYYINEQSCALWKTCCILYQLFSCHFSHRKQMLVLASNKDLLLTSRWWMLLAFLRHNWTRCAKVANCSTSPPLIFNTCKKQHMIRETIQRVIYSTYIYSFKERW